jgi:hypothetical protein
MSMATMPRRLPWRDLGEAAAPLALGVITLGCAIAIAKVGPVMAIVPFAVAAGIGCVAYPRQALFVLVIACVAVDSAPEGRIGAIAGQLWEFPPAIAAQMPLKTSPYEVLITLTAIGALLRPAALPRPALPGLVWGIPIVMALGAAWGIANHGPVNLVYHESRGLLFGSLAFIATWRTGGLSDRQAAKLVIVATTLLGLLVLVRVGVEVRSGAITDPKEFWFGHESGLMLAAGTVLGALLFLRAKSDRARVLLALYTAFTLVANALTDRRSGILALAVGLMIVAWLLFPKRPVLMTILGVAVAVGGGIYLAAFWNVTSGVGEPAQAIRSQFQPDARDASSDQYRTIEAHNLEQTLMAGPIFGVGFGRPFTEYEPLPPLTFWPLQTYTPHENILWLWLKMGIVGIAVLLGTWVIAVRRCFTACRAVPRWREVPIRPIVLAAVLAMYLVYGSVDLAFVPSRSVVPLAVALALVFLSRDLPAGAREQQP